MIETNEDEIRKYFKLEHVKCCISCHEDEGHGYEMAFAFYKDKYVEVCCTLANAIIKLN